jgi:hypothetical protein
VVPRGACIGEVPKGNPKGDPDRGAYQGGFNKGVPPGVPRDSPKDALPGGVRVGPTCPAGGSHRGNPPHLGPSVGSPGWMNTKGPTGVSPRGGTRGVP